MERYPLDQVALYRRKAASAGSVSEIIANTHKIHMWQRISRLVKKIQDLEAVSELILNGQEQALRMFWREEDKTRNELIAIARDLHVKNYGKLTKKELKLEIDRYQRDKIVRQRFERKS